MLLFFSGALCPAHLEPINGFCFGLRLLTIQSTSFQTGPPVMQRLTLSGPTSVADAPSQRWIFWSSGRVYSTVCLMPPPHRLLLLPSSIPCPYLPSLNYAGVWMSDGPRTQQRLANDLASLVNNMQEEHTFLFLECFWETMAREWDGIDALRMDKFLLLVRRYLESSFRYLTARDWVENEVRRYMDILKGAPLQYVFHGKLVNWRGQFADFSVAAPQVSKSQMVSVTT